jgi:hypothetical protein
MKIMRLRMRDPTLLSAIVRRPMLSVEVRSCGSIMGGARGDVSLVDFRRKVLGRRPVKVRWAAEYMHVPDVFHHIKALRNMSKAISESHYRSKYLLYSTNF